MQTASSVTANPYDGVKQVSQADTLTPADRYQELFVEVQMNCIFDDGKTFVDCAPRQAPDAILELYRSRCNDAGFDLKAFVLEQFEVVETPSSAFVSDPNRTLAAHIESLWPVLTRHPQEHPFCSSILPLPFDYIVPGGRFSELYYWDSYFTMVGLHGANRSHLLAAMADNFAYLIDTYGHIPNGNRTYYLSRSQPPVFSLMVDLFEKNGVREAVDYLPQLRKEYGFWMAGGEDLRTGEGYRRCVRMGNGALLNRYWDDRDTPREESYREDVLTAQRSNRPVHDVYRDLRAGAESGWDFSSRWQIDPYDLATICTTNIVPIDLNCLLYKLELQIAALAQLKDDVILADEFFARAETRKEAINFYCWNETEGAFFDYHWRYSIQRKNLTAATLTPMFVKLASENQAEQLVKIVEERLLVDGGISTTEFNRTQQQWDRPNGWAPLQWMSILGLRNYGYTELASQISWRWLSIVSGLYECDSKLVEKYILRPTEEHACGGEYPLQDGFGWTNGVTYQLLKDNPKHPANFCRAGNPHEFKDS
ncbi:alpha,alpha-trehalase TreF [Cellvibrio sp. NN19]|uniref:alpha,alpha-trehalase TreF n=1 Tax=Cellvibrio chitinivorans TaxID=3102792 RepID=UPI002B401F45|nr:alpha,alpha-trehalase TreF [Cellvibrio sp. NN19]